MKERLANGRRSRGHARAQWVLIPVAAVASMAIWLLQPLPGAQIAALAALASTDAAAEQSVPNPLSAGAAAAAAPVLDHSVVRSKQLADEPDMTGASIAAYAP